MPRVYIAGCLACLFSVPAMAQQSDDLNFASGLEQFHNIRRMLPSYLNNIGLRMLGERKHRVEQLATIEDVDKRRSYVREQMLKDLGGFPDRAHLNARVVGVLERTGYRIEKVIFESQPHFYVTANLYLPTTGHPPYPAILYPLGHERGGKTNPTWQQMLGSLATKGFVALTWDPIGQGERLQIFDEDLRESKVGNSTTEHTVVGTQCMLVGDHLARYTIWDGRRALDYLLSRKEVDPARIGLTGNSGGGTHTAYIAALDDRIPGCGALVLYHILALNARHDWSTGRRANVPPLAAGGVRLSGLSSRICPQTLPPPFSHPRLLPNRRGSRDFCRSRESLFGDRRKRKSGNV